MINDTPINSRYSILVKMRNALEKTVLINNQNTIQRTVILVFKDKVLSQMCEANSQPTVLHCYNST